MTSSPFLNLVLNPWLNRFLFISWAATIFYLSSLSRIASPNLFHFQDKFIHAIAYAALSFFLAGALQNIWLKEGRKKLLITCLIVILYGITDEWHQYYTPGRHADIYDVIADAVGAVLGVWLFRQLTAK